MNAAPAVSNDGSTLYVAVSEGDFNGGYLVALDSATLQPIGTGLQVRLKDPNGRDAILPDDGSASPTVGPDGDVYFGVLENPLGRNHDRGWLLHFSGDLTKSYAPGAFGWDDTASIVPATMIPTYTGTSTYLLMTKYNNYAGGGGDGINKLAIVDPQATMIDPVTHATVMKEVLTIAGVTPDDEFGATNPGAVREWCINSAVVDPQTGSVLANSEDGRLYRWNLATNSFTQSITLTAGVGEAYTPTLIGVDGTVYAINDATLFAVRGTRSRFDVDGDGQVAPKDLVVLIIYLNGYGASNAPPPGDTGPYLDVNGDGLVAPNDILQVISFLNGISTGEGEEAVARSSSSTLNEEAVPTGELLDLLASDIVPQSKRALR
jgi:hypothetical protein